MDVKETISINGGLVCVIMSSQRPTLQGPQETHATRNGVADPICSDW